MNNDRIDEIKKELESIRMETLNKKLEINMKREKFLKENKGLMVFCRKCNMDRPVEEFTLVFRTKLGNPHFQCKICKRRRNEKRTINKVLERGY